MSFFKKTPPEILHIREEIMFALRSLKVKVLSNTDRNCHARNFAEIDFTVQLILQDGGKEIVISEAHTSFTMP